MTFSILNSTYLLWNTAVSHYVIATLGKQDAEPKLCSWLMASYSPQGDSYAINLQSKTYLIDCAFDASGFLSPIWRYQTWDLIKILGTKQVMKKVRSVLVYTREWKIVIAKSYTWCKIIHRLCNHLYCWIILYIMGRNIKISNGQFRYFPKDKFRSKLI